MDEKLGALSKRLIDLKQTKKKIGEYAKANNSQIEECTQDILAEMEGLGIEKATTSFCSLSIGVRMFSSIKDWDKFFEFVTESGAKEFLRKQASDAAVKEYLEKNGVLPPGLDSYLKDTLSARISVSYKQELKGKD